MFIRRLGGDAVTRQDRRPQVGVPAFDFSGEVPGDVCGAAVDEPVPTGG